MRHHQYNTNCKLVEEPVYFDKYTDREFLQYCLGATLYMPGTKKIVDKILDKSLTDITSLVMCFEDAIQEKDLEGAESNVLSHLDKISEAISKHQLNSGDVPLIFVRVRNFEQLQQFLEKINRKQLSALSGFVFPKFNSTNAEKYLQTVDYTSQKHDTLLYSMPILEGKAIAFKETRKHELIHIKNTLESYKNQILNIRVGGTDISALFGVRRGISYSIYDILTVRDCLSDILNFFSRSEDDYLVSAPVWEYFLASKTDNINHLLHDNIHKSLNKRTPIINDAIDGLLREVILDKANGFVGKTIIHPSHAKFVNALQAVTLEEFEDATQIISTQGGVVKSSKQNKMNEINPHKSWAKKTILRAKAYGIVENDISYLKLISG